MSYPVQTPGAGAYLRTRILSASSSELRLMLFDGALRFIRAGRVELARERPDFEKLFESFARAKKIVVELGSGLDRDRDPALCDRMTGVCDFVYRLLVESNLERDVSKADQALELLTYERETWALAVERAGNESASAGSASATAPSGPLSRSA